MLYFFFIVIFYRKVVNSISFLVFFLQLRTCDVVSCGFSRSVHIDVNNLHHKAHHWCCTHDVAAPSQKKTHTPDKFSPRDISYDQQGKFNPPEGSQSLKKVIFNTKPYMSNISIQMCISTSTTTDGWIK